MAGVELEQYTGLHDMYVECLHANHPYGCVVDACIAYCSSGTRSLLSKITGASNNILHSKDVYSSVASREGKNYQIVFFLSSALSLALISR